MDKKHEPVVYLDMMQTLADMNVADRLLHYMKTNPGKTSREMSEALGLLDNTARYTLTKLLAEGKVRKLPRVDGEKRSRWDLGEDEEYTKRVNAVSTWDAKRPTVTEWEPHMVRDELTAALFGPAKHKEGENN